MFITSPTVTSVIYTLSLHDALPIYEGRTACGVADHWPAPRRPDGVARLRRLRGGTPLARQVASATRDDGIVAGNRAGDQKTAASAEGFARAARQFAMKRRGR